MNSSQKRRLFGCLLAVLALWSLACHRGEEDGDSGVIQIGLAAPLTGPEAQTGQDMRDGALLAIEEVNKAGGVAGHQLELIARDDKADPKEAASVAKYFVSSPRLLAVVGHLNSDCSLAAARIYEQASMAMVTPVSTSDALTTKGNNNVFRIPIRNSIQGSSAAEWVAAKKYRRIAVLDDGGAYGDGIASEFQKAVVPLIKGYGGEVVARERFNKDETDFRPLLAKIGAESVDCVYFGGMYPAAALFLKQSAERGMSFDLVGGDGIFAPKFIELAGKPAERAYMTFIAPLPSAIEQAPPFYRNFSQRFGHKPIVYSPLSYDAASVVIEALKKVGTTDREKIRQVLHAQDFVWEGVTGSIRFDEAGEGIQRRPFFYTVENGDFRLLDK